MKLVSLSIGISLLSVFSIVSCSSNPNAKQVGTLAGAGMGAIAGAVAGNNIGGLDSKEGAIAGAVLGGVLGNMNGRSQDQINGMRGEMGQMRDNADTLVNVTNSNGSFTPVSLRKTPSGWQGPRGEVYPSFPTDTQLQQAYGF